MGFDGNQVWLDEENDGDYKGNPKFYYNLYFYFYAMPFILADDGINYKDAEPLVFEGKTYPGIEITYNNGVGETPEDRYILYYNATTFNMEWLGYTVNFVEGIDKKELHFRYLLHFLVNISFLLHILLVSNILLYLEYLKL